jgi:hypothetical protein
VIAAELRPGDRVRIEGRRFEITGHTDDGRVVYAREDSDTVLRRVVGIDAAADVEVIT